MDIYNRLPARGLEAFRQWARSEPRIEFRTKRWFCQQLLTVDFYHYDQIHKEVVLRQILRRLDICMFRGILVDEHIYVQWLDQLPGDALGLTHYLTRPDGGWSYLIQFSANEYHYNGDERDGMLLATLAHELLHVLEHKRGHQCVYRLGHCQTFELLAYQTANQLEIPIGWFQTINDHPDWRPP